MDACALSALDSTWADGEVPLAGCRCEQCFGLAEAMFEITGKDYGLNPAPGHAPPHLREVEQPSSSMTDLDPEEFKRLQERARNRVRFPWENAA